MRKFRNYLPCLVLVMCGVVMSMFAQSVLAAKKPSYLFVLSAQSGVVVKKQADYQLILKNVDRHVLWFTDRPNRQAGFIPLKQFVTNWSEGFKNDPPNAALIHADLSVNESGHQQPLAIELKHPVYHGKCLVFILKLLDDGAAKLTQKKLMQPKLFIDPPAARLVDFHQAPMQTPVGPIRIPQVGPGPPPPGVGNVVIAD